MYSFGVVLWELYSYGKVPFEGMGFNKVVDHLKSGKRLEKPQNCPAFVFELMEACWQVQPSERPDMEHCFLKLETQVSQKSFVKSDHKTVVVAIDGHDYRVAKPV